MNSQVILRRAYALVITLVLSLLIGNKMVYGQSVTFTPNGVWLPSMTSNERITMPVTMGQLVFDTNTKSIWYHTGVGGDWKELITVKAPADNLGNHTATQNVNLGDYFLSPDGSDRGLKVGREQLLLQSPKPRFQLGTNLATNSQINFANYTRNWAISTSQDRFEIVDSTFQTRPFIIEKNAFHNMLYIQGDKIGIGTNAPREKLEVAGKIKMNGFQLFNGTNTAGFVLQSDAGGNGTWVSTAAAGLNYWSLANGGMFANQNVNIGIGTETPTSKLEVNGKLKATDVEVAAQVKTSLLEVAGTTKTTNLQLTNGATNGYILQSDASGNAVWKDPSSLPISFSETDPKVGTLTNNVLPKWNGTKLSDGTIVDNGNVGIGVTAPTNKLEVAGTTKTTNLQLTNGATNGYILQSDASGNAVWKDPSSLPISFSETDPKVGTLSNNVLPKWNGTKLSDGTIVDNGNVGIGVASPTNKLEVAGTTKTTNLQLTNGATNGYILQSDASGNATWKDPASLPISFSETDPKVGTLSNNVLPKWNGTKLSDGTIVDNGNVGIGVTAPTNKLEVAGTTKTTNFQLTNGATNGYILQSDASGNAVWKDPASLPISFSETDPKVGVLTNNVLPKWNGTKLSDGSIVDNGNVGIGVTAPTNKLEVAGTTKTTNFQLTNGATNGYILQSDASGNAVWKDPSSLPISFSETDPKVGTLTNNVLPKWNGTKLSDGTIVDNGNVGIGVTAPTNKLEVAGTTKTTNLQLTNGATNGYILQSDASGNAVWKDPSSLPISFSETDPKVGTLTNNVLPKWNGTKLSDGTIVDNGNVGIGVAAPTNKLEVAGTTKTTNFQLTNGATNGYILQSDASGNAVWKDPASLPISFSETDPKVGTLSNNVLPKWNGTKLSDGTIVDNGNVGIGVAAPTNKLEVAGTTKTTNFQLTNGATNGYILQSDASGNAVWKDPASLPISFSETDPKVGTLSNNVLPKWNGTKLSDGTIVDNGNVGIGVTAPTNKLEVAGTTKTTNFQLTNGATNGYILQSDASGNATWKNPTSLGISFTETDPKVGSQSLDYVPTWNGNKLVKGSIFDNRQGRIGILNDDPKAPFSVGESYVTNLDAITYFNTSENKPVVFASIDKATPANNKGVMIGEQGNEIQGRSGDNLTTNGDLILNAYDGNVGIGTTTPSSKLDVEGKIKSTDLQLTNGATNGYILQSDASGNAVWKDPSSLPISFNETDPKVGTLTNNVLPKWNGTKLTDGTMVDNGNIGIGVTSPTNKLEVAGTTLIGSSYASTKAVAPPNGLAIEGFLNLGRSSSTTQDTTSKMAIYTSKTRALTLNGDNVLGTWLKMYNGLKNWDFVVTGSGNGEGTGAFLLRDTRTVRMMISAEGKMGINTTSPSTELEVAGTTKTTNLQLTNGATNGYVLQSDASGNAIWKDPASLPINFSETDPKVGTLTNNVLPKWNGTKLTDGTIVDNGNVGIGVTAPTNKLEVAGTTKTTNLQLTNGATNGYVLQSDASGNASWVNPSTLSSGSTSWTKNGNNQYSSVTGNVGVGVSSPTQKLHLRGNLLVEHGRLLTYDSGKNVYVGEEVGGADTTYTKGQHNTAIGANAFQNNTTGNNNVAVGRKALQSNTTGNFNTSIGTESLNSVVGGGFNVAIGPYSLVNNVSGNENVAVGNMAGFSNKGNGNVFLGNSAGSFETGSNKLYIANTNTSAPLIYGDFSKKKLVVNDSLETKFLSVKMPNASSYFPNATINNQSVVTQIHVGNNANPKTRYYDKTNSPSSFFDIGINSYNYFSVDYNEATKFAVLPNGMVELSNNLKTFGKWITADGDNEGVVIDNEGNVGVNEVSSSVAFTVKTKKSTGGLFLIEDNNGDDKFYMSIKGNAGMGTSDLSKAKLTIVGSQLSNLSYGYLNNNGSTGSASSTSYYSLYTSDRIAASEFNAYSDARIKDIKGKTNNTADLETLAKIEITDYQFKDKIGKGNGHHKKVIAQQVETVYPQAVSKTTDIIPDIYRLANIQNNFVELPHHQLTVGEKVKLIFGEKQEVFEVEAVNEKGFKVKNNGTALLAATSVFVYGREVSDFRSVDYEALSTLNISATQALLKRIEKLESENALYKTEFTSFKTELEQLKAAVIGKQETKGK